MMTSHPDATSNAPHAAASARRFEVIIPVRNGGEILTRSLQKVLSVANERRVLLTVSDNHSTDGSPWRKMLADYAPERWRIITPPQPLGRVEHWTWAFNQAQLPWIKPLMVGDRTDDAFWDWAEAAIAKFPEAAIFFCNSYVIDPSAAHADSNGTASVPIGADTFYHYEDFLRDAVQCFNRIGALSQALMRTDIVRAALPFEIEYPWTADWRFCQRCMAKAPAVYNAGRMVCLDRSIARMSTSWKGLRSSVCEDWKFAAQQARATGVPWLPAALTRSRSIGSRMIFFAGRKILPARVRRTLTSITGIHRKDKSA